MYISKIEISNIRCFKNLEIDLEKNGKPINWTTILGDNSTGKTTLLRSVAIGLCDESSAAGLLKETEQGFVRSKAKNATIKIYLKKNEKDKIKIIETKIKKTRYKKNNYENLRHNEETTNFEEWDDLFVCAYGIGRGSAGTGDISGYSAISAVYNLFNYSEGLQNPELVFYRLRTERKKSEAIKSLVHILDLGEGERIYFEKDGVKVRGNWNSKIPLRDLADGYRSTFQWVMDFIGWAVSFKPKVSRSSSIKGILLIDGLEEHLHPIWQRTIVSKLNKIFPNIQFIITTHSPLIASSTVDLKNSQVISLELKSHNIVRSKKINAEQLKGKRVDQVLRSDAFDLPATMSMGSISDVTKYSQLRFKKNPTKEEHKELQKLRKRFKENVSFGDTEYESKVRMAITETLKKMIKSKDSPLYNLELNKQLKEIFK